MKKVSVIITAYQHARFISDAIGSVLAQTYPDDELIVVDDGSTDGTREIVTNYGNQLVYIYQENRGSAAARNSGIRAATGEYVAFLDADDVWLPNKLELEVKFLDAHPSIGMVYSNYTYFGTRPGPAATGFAAIPPVSGQALKELFLSNPISSSSVLIRKSCFEKVGFFDESLVHGEDLDMWLRLAPCCEIDNIAIPLAKTRLYETNKHLRIEGELIGQIALRRKCLQANPSLAGEIGPGMMREKYYGLYLLLAHWYLQIRARRKAMGPLWQYLKRCRFRPAALTSVSIALSLSLLLIPADILRPVLGWSYPVMNRAIGKVVVALLK